MLNPNQVVNERSGQTVFIQSCCFNAGIMGKLDLPGKSILINERIARISSETRAPE